MSSSPIEQDPSSTQTFGVVDVANAVDSPVVGLSQQDAAAIAALPSGTALLLVHHGPTTGARFLLDAEETTVGRHPRADIFLDDVTVSRKHAVFSSLPDGGYGSMERMSTARVWSKWRFAPVTRSRSASTG